MGGNHRVGGGAAWGGTRGRGHSPQHLLGDRQLVALQVLAELAEVAEVGDLLPELVAEKAEPEEEGEGGRGGPGLWGAKRALPVFHGEKMGQKAAAGPQTPEPRTACR